MFFIHRVDEKNTLCRCMIYKLDTNYGTCLVIFSGTTRDGLFRLDFICTLCLHNRHSNLTVFWIDALELGIIGRI